MAMLIERNHNGSWCISAIIRGSLFTRTYYGYTKREAVAEFRHDRKQFC